MNAKGEILYTLDIKNVIVHEESARLELVAEAVIPTTLGRNLVLPIELITKNRRLEQEGSCSSYYTQRRSAEKGTYIDKSPLGVIRQTFRIITIFFSKNIRQDYSKLEKRQLKNVLYSGA